MKPTRLLIGLAALIAALSVIPLGYQAVTGQPIGANTILQTDAPSGVAPAFRANGQDANISINLVPKGTGSVLVGGVPIAVSGGTIGSLSINPGPLAVTGTTNLTGPLFIQPGTAAVLKGVPARVFHDITDKPTTGLVIETLYTYTAPANILSADGQSLHLVIDASVAANANNKQLTIVYGATTLYVTGLQAFNNVTFRVDCWIFRTGAATQKAACQAVAASAAAGGAMSLTTNTGSQVTTPAEVLSGPVTILVRGTTPTAAADLTGRFATVDWYPVGQ